MIKNVELLPPNHITPWRKISLGSWRPVGDSQVYCELKVECKRALDYIAEKNSTSGEKITLVHFVGQVMGKVLRDVPDINAIVRLGKIQQRKDVDVFFHVAYGGSELSGHVVRQIDQKPLSDIARELTENGLLIKRGEDKNFNRIKNSWKFLPGFVARGVLDLIGFVTYTLNINMAGLGVPRDCFGSIMITSIGSLGFQSAFVPLAPYTRIPLVLALGKPEYRPVCDSRGNVTSELQVSLCFTFDHRIMDGARGALMAKAIKKYFRRPELLEA